MTALTLQLLPPGERLDGPLGRRLDVLAHGYVGEVRRAGARLGRLFLLFALLALLLTDAANVLPDLVTWAVLGRDPVARAHLEQVDALEKRLVRPLAASGAIAATVVAAGAYALRGLLEPDRFPVFLRILEVFLIGFGIVMLTASAWLEVRSGIVAQLAANQRSKARFVLILGARITKVLWICAGAYILVAATDRIAFRRAMLIVDGAEAHMGGLAAQFSDDCRRDSVPPATVDAAVVRVGEVVARVRIARSQLELVTAGMIRVARECFVVFGVLALVLWVLVPILYTEVSRIAIVVPMLVVSLYLVEQTIAHYLPGLAGTGGIMLPATALLVIVSSEIVSGLLRHGFHQHRDCWHPACRHENQWIAERCAACLRPLPAPAYLGNADTRVAHRLGCERVEEVPGRRLHAYGSIEDAELNGFRPCKVCIPAV